VWRSFFVWVATNPEEAAGLAAALVSMLTALAVALEKRAPKAAAVIRSLVPFIVGVVRAIKRPDASTGPAHKVVQPVIVADASRVVDADAAGAPAAAPTKEAPKVPPVVFLLCAAFCGGLASLAGCGVSAAQIDEGVRKLDAAEQALQIVVDGCEAGYRKAPTPEDFARLEALCVPSADALDAVHVAAAGLRGAAGLVAAARGAQASKGGSP
jgi:hypothetical protein